jgi:hypothetical protein
MSFPLCTSKFADGMRAAAFDLGVKWANDPVRPRISAEATSAWSALIAEWVADRTLPLLVRRFRGNRGSSVVGADGRMLIPVDNSPAQWAFAMAHSGSCPNLSEIMSLLESGSIPLAMALTTEERARAIYKGIAANARVHLKLAGNSRISRVLPSTVGETSGVTRYWRSNDTSLGLCHPATCSWCLPTLPD